MISPGDGIAFFGVCAVIITAIVKFGGKKTMDNDEERTPQRRETDAYVRIATCEAIKEGLLREANETKCQIREIFKQLKAMDRFLRGDGHDFKREE